MTTTGRCPRGAAQAAQARRDAFVAGHEAGRIEGFREAAELRAEVGVPLELADMWRTLIRLLHAACRQKEASEATIALLEWRSRVEARRGR
jgi:hypothetical protein